MEFSCDSLTDLGGDSHPGAIRKSGRGGEGLSGKTRDRIRQFPPVKEFSEPQSRSLDESAFLRADFGMLKPSGMGLIDQRYSFSAPALLLDLRELVRWKGGVFPEGKHDTYLLSLFFDTTGIYFILFLCYMSNDCSHESIVWGDNYKCVNSTLQRVGECQLCGKRIREVWFEKIWLDDDTEKEL